MWSVEVDGVMHACSMTRASADWLFERLVAAGRHGSVDVYQHGDFVYGWSLHGGSVSEED